jgi:protein involved in sex pheromone biosynthesis
MEKLNKDVQIVSEDLYEATAALTTLEQIRKEHQLATKKELEEVSLMTGNFVAAANAEKQTKLELDSQYKITRKQKLKEARDKASEMRTKEEEMYEAMKRGVELIKDVKATSLETENLKAKRSFEKK